MAAFSCQDDSLLPTHRKTYVSMIAANTWRYRGADNGIRCFSRTWTRFWRNGSHKEINSLGSISSTDPTILRQRCLSGESSTLSAIRSETNSASRAASIAPDGTGFGGENFPYVSLTSSKAPIGVYDSLDTSMASTICLDNRLNTEGDSERCSRRRRRLFKTPNANEVCLMCFSTTGSNLSSPYVSANLEWLRTWRECGPGNILGDYCVNSANF